MPRYIAFYKPYAVLCAFTDREGRSTLSDYIPVRGVYSAGRLDYDSEGLLILTDDRDLNHRLTDPRFEHRKSYLVQVEGVVDPARLDPIRRGLVLRGRTVRPAEVEIVAEPGVPPPGRPIRNYHPTTWLRIVMTEGKKRQVRRMTAALGYPTLRLVRVAMGEVTLGQLQPGQWRDLTRREIIRLRLSVGLGG